MSNNGSQAKAAEASPTTWTIIALPFKAFHHRRFKYFLTLFSKFFSSFPHGTCPLSVSPRYLALEGSYLPLWAALPSNPTRWKHALHANSEPKTGLSPSLTSVSTELRPSFAIGITPLDYNSKGSRLFDFRLELFPYHSPLQREF